MVRGITVLCVVCGCTPHENPKVTEDEIANAAGVGDVHVINCMRAMCYCCGEGPAELRAYARGTASSCSHHASPVPCGGADHPQEWLQPALEATTALQGLIRRVYDKFVDEQIISLSKCRDDLQGMTRFVTWDEW